jgi:hypothetical protein
MSTTDCHGCYRPVPTGQGVEWRHRRAPAVAYVTCDALSCLERSRARFGADLLAAARPLPSPPPAAAPHAGAFAALARRLAALPPDAAALHLHPADVDRYLLPLTPGTRAPATFNGLPLVRDAAAPRLLDA